MRIDEAVSDVKPLDVKFGPAALHIEYSPPAFTLNELSANKENKDDPDRVVAMIQRIIKAWDLTRVVKADDGQEIEVLVDLRNAAELKEYVPITIWNKITTAIREDNSAGEA